MNSCSFSAARAARMKPLPNCWSSYSTYYRDQGGNMVFAATGDGLGRGIRRLEERLDNPWNQCRMAEKGTAVSAHLGPGRRRLHLQPPPNGRPRGNGRSPAGHRRTARSAARAYRSRLHAHARSQQRHGRLSGHRAHQARRPVAEKGRTGAADGPRRRAACLHRRAGSGHQRKCPVRPFLTAADRANTAVPIRSSPANTSWNRLTIASGLFPAAPPGPDARPPPASPHPPQARRPSPCWISAARTKEPPIPWPNCTIRRRDYTVCTIVEVEESAGEGGPIYHAVDIFVDHGSRHFESFPGRPVPGRSPAGLPGTLADNPFGLRRHRRWRRLMRLAQRSSGQLTRCTLQIHAPLQSRPRRRFPDPDRNRPFQILDRRRRAGRIRRLLVLDPGRALHLRSARRRQL